jgi:alkanesulfonate monooxygenase SsuD/methylene tetrahydromethanopterin reductase-like flavin-dependent oxidoreductase (luciferase family)
VKYGLSFPNGGPRHDARRLAEFAHIAEEAGWDGAFLEDYIVWQGHMDTPTYDPWVALAAMALNTHQIRLGTMVTALPRRRPWKLARETVTLDHLSNGRMILGVGLGDVTLDVSFTHFREVTDAKERAKMTDEGLDVLVGLWSGRPFSFDGEYYHVKEVTLLPRPVQTPRIPIWIGGIYPRKGPLRRAARWDGACLYKVTNDDMTPADVRGLKTFVQSQRVSTGPYDIVLGGRHRSADWEKDRALIGSLGEAGATWWIEYLPPTLYRNPEEIRSAIERGPLRID